MATKVYAITIARDEEDILAHTIRHLFAEGIDGLIVGLHQSDSATCREIGRLSQSLPLLARFFPEPHFRQAQMMTQLANTARNLGADWILPFDADEYFVADGQTVGAALRASPAAVLSLRMKNYVATGYDDANDPNPFTREQWAREPWNPLNKVAFRWQSGIAVAQGSHYVHINGQRLPETAADNLVIGHFQNRSAAQFIRKIRNEGKGYAGMDANLGYWHKFNHLSDAEITEWWAKDYFVADPRAAGLVHIPAQHLAEHAGLQRTFA